MHAFSAISLSLMTIASLAGLAVLLAEPVDASSMQCGFTRYIVDKYVAGRRVAVADPRSFRCCCVYPEASLALP
jgi:hypothetical protein